MAEEFDGDKTEQATPRKRQEAREQGRVARSKEINSALVLLFGLVSLYLSGTWLLSGAVDLLYRDLGGLSKATLTPEGAGRLVGNAAFVGLKAFSPFLLCVFAIGVLASYGQVGFVLNKDAFALKWERIDPFNGLKRLLSMRSLAELIVSLLKLTVVGLVAYVFIRSQMATVAAMVDQNAPQILYGICRLIFQLMFWTAGALVALAIMDYGYQWWQHEKDLRMSRREIMEELRRTEGDPQIKARVRQIQREMSRRRMLHKVPTADVVITNPTHYAVALKYDQSKMKAPEVVAKGKNLMAKRIREVAIANHVPLVANPPLAQALYKTVEVGDHVPPTLYRAVAQVLAQIYRLRQMARARLVT